MLFTSTTPLATLLRIRPAAVELLEATGKPFWDRLEKSVDEFCRDASLNASDLLKRAADLPVPPGDTNFGQEPLYRIVDFLTANHRAFQEKDLPEINHLLDVHNIPVYPDGYVLKLAYQSFKSFEEKFREHMREEEEHVFPLILHLEACTRVPALKSLLHRGSVSVFAAQHTHASEEDLKRMITDVRMKIRNHLIQEPTAAVTGEICEMMERFEARLASHAGLETGVLFPRAAEIERRLFDLEFAGRNSPYSFHPEP